MDLDATCHPPAYRVRHDLPAWVEGIGANKCDWTWTENELIAEPEG
jgi:hypothetical protein